MKFFKENTAMLLNLVSLYLLMLHHPSNFGTMPFPPVYILSTGTSGSLSPPHPDSITYSSPISYYFNPPPISPLSLAPLDSLLTLPSQPRNIHPMQTRAKSNVVQPCIHPTFRYHLTNILLAINRCFGLKKTLMALLTSIRPDLWPKVFIKDLALITMRCLIGFGLVLDVNNAFLNGFLDEDVYMNQPLGFEASNKTLICKLNKTIYALCAWFDRLKSTLFQLGYKASKCDPSLFIQSINSMVVYILVYVDDIIVTSNNLLTLNLSFLGSTQHFL
ncbi:hypothetical protein CR513_51777, partial [Mucuna pruriens]